MRLVLGLDRPTAGTATIDGRRYRDLDHPLRTVGALLDPRQFQPHRTVAAHLRWIAASNAIPRARVDEVLGEVGLGGEEIFIRMTGCPNGCARPYMAEIGFVGKGPGRYQLWLGGNATSTRINRVYKEIVKEAEILPELKVLFTRFAAERQTGERFGDWVARTVWNETPAAAA